MKANKNSKRKLTQVQAVEKTSLPALSPEEQEQADLDFLTCEVGLSILEERVLNGDEEAEEIIHEIYARCLEIEKAIMRAEAGNADLS